MGKQKAQHQTQEQQGTQGETTPAQKKTRRKQDVIPMQLRKLPITSENPATELGVFVANVKDVGGAKKYLRKSPTADTDGHYIVVSIKAILKPKVEVVSRVKFE